MKIDIYSKYKLVTIVRNTPRKKHDKETANVYFQLLPCYDVLAYLYEQIKLMGYEFLGFKIADNTITIFGKKRTIFITIEKALEN